MAGENGYERPGVAGSGAIACGLAAVATTAGETVLLARKQSSAERAQARVEKACGKLEGADAGRLKVTTDPADLAGCDVVVEAIVEKVETKGELLETIAEAAPDADLATTTSSLGVAEIAAAGGVAGRFYGLHVFNPVPRMDLIEVCFPDGLREGARERALAWCEALGKTAIEVPDQPGFVVNRLLFPFLFDAVRMMERTGMDAKAVDTSMKMGAGHPMGPLALLDFVGLDVAEAIGDAIHADTDDPAHHPPGLMIELIGAEKLGRKSGEGFFKYE